MCDFNNQFVPMSKEELEARTRAMRNGEIKMRREGCYWSAEEDEVVLFKFYKLYETTTQIAIEHIPMSKADIIAGLLDVYKYHVTEDEIIELIRKSKKTFQIIIEDGSEAYRLTDDVYKHTLELQRKGIDFYIDQFIDAAKIEDREKCKDAIYKYLYELTTTNINSYRILLLGNQGEAFHDSDISVDITELDTDEKVYVRDFLEWNDAAKNALRLHKAIVKARQDGFRNNPVKENKIKRALYQILNDEDEVERIYQIVVEQEEY